MNGTKMQPADLFPSLGDGEPGKAEKKSIGKSFRAWALSEASLRLTLPPEPGKAK